MVQSIREKNLERNGPTSDFARWLDREARLLGWSLPDLAGRSGLSPATLDEVLADAASPTWELCARLGQVLQLSPVMVFRQAGLLPSLPEAGDERLAEVFEILAVLPEGPIFYEATVAIRAVARRASRRAQGNEA